MCHVALYGPGLWAKTAGCGLVGRYSERTTLWPSGNNSFQNTVYVAWKKRVFLQWGGFMGLPAGISQSFTWNKRPWLHAGPILYDKRRFPRRRQILYTVISTIKNNFFKFNIKWNQLRSNCLFHVILCFSFALIIFLRISGSTFFNAHADKRHPLLQYFCQKTLGSKCLLHTLHRACSFSFNVIPPN